MKKLLIMLCAIALVSGSLCTTTNAAVWKHYFGINSGWYEGAEASLVKNNYTNWTVKMQSMGWGGCWGGYVSRKINIRKGNKYRLKFSLKSTQFDKWVFVKIGNKSGTKIVYAKWINCKKGKTVKINKKIKAKYNAKRIYFGFGGDYGDREAANDGTDAKIRYKYAPNNILDGRLPHEYSAEHYTKIKCTGFMLEQIFKPTKTHCIFPKTFWNHF